MLLNYGSPFTWESVTENVTAQSFFCILSLQFSRAYLLPCTLTLLAYLQNLCFFAFSQHYTHEPTYPAASWELTDAGRC